MLNLETKADLQKLITDGIAESLMLEFRRCRPLAAIQSLTHLLPLRSA